MLLNLTQRITNATTILERIQARIEDETPEEIENNLWITRRELLDAEAVLAEFTTDSLSDESGKE